MRVSILQWNIWFKENIERVVAVLKAHPADIICLQELTRGYSQQTHENTWEYIAHELRVAYRVQEIPIITAESRWTQGNMICSHLPIKSSWQTWLHEPHDPDSSTDQYRGYLEATLAIPGGDITVATTHMSFGVDLQEDPELDRLLNIIGTKREQFVLTGDFNATPETRRITEVEKLLRHAGPPYAESSWTTKPFTHLDFTNSTLDRRLDYVFTTRDLATLEATLIPTTTSDHLPIRVVIETPQP